MADLNGQLPEHGLFMRNSDTVPCVCAVIIVAVVAGILIGAEGGRSASPGGLSSMVRAYGSWALQRAL